MGHGVKLILLPGMDGRGELFDDFLRCFKGDATVIRFPEGKDQSYSRLSHYVIERLPDSEFILLAESFSGGLVQHLVNVPKLKLKGVIFAASFISPPHGLLLHLFQRLPLKVLMSLPGVQWFYRWFLLGSEIHQGVLDQFVRVLTRVCSDTLKQRMQSMSCMRPMCSEGVKIPAVYLRPNQDRLISFKKYKEIATSYREAQCYKLDGPHFILQAKPAQSAALVDKAIQHIISCSQ